MENMEIIVTENDKRLSIHEAVCAERYEGIQEAFTKGTKRMQKIEYLLYAVIGSVLLGPNFAAELIKKFLG
jgi:hypothetical protein